MQRTIFFSLLLCLSLAASAKTLIVKVNYDKHGYHIDQMQVLDRTFNASSSRPVQQNALHYQFFDADGVVLAEGIVTDPSLLAAEFHGSPTSGNHGEILQQTNGSFMIRIPYVESMTSLSLSRLEVTDDFRQQSTSLHTHSGSPHVELKPRLLNEFDLSRYLQPKN